MGIMDTKLTDLATEAGKYLGFHKGYWPDFMPTGTLPGTLTTAALASLLGAGVVAPIFSKGLRTVAPRSIQRDYPNLFNPRTSSEAFGGLGAVMGAAPFLPFLLSNYASHGTAGLFNQEEPQPQQKTAQSIDTQAALAQIAAATDLGPFEKARAMQAVVQAAGGPSGWLSAERLLSALMGAGLGYGAGAILNRLLGTSSLSTLGVLTGALKGLGVF